MHDVELTLSRPVNVTDTGHIRAYIGDRVRSEGLTGPPVELVQFNVFILCTEGFGRHMVDFEEHPLRPGTAIWVRPGQVQRWSETHDGFDATVVVFDSAVVPDLPLFDGLRAYVAVTDLGPDAALLRDQMDWLARDLEATGDHALAAAVVGVMLRLFARHGDAARDRSDSPRQLLAEAFVRSVEEHIDQRSVAWHAQRVGASPRTVARATNHAFSQPPKELIDALVMLEARRRLAWSGDDVAVIARALGFSDSSNFTKFFRGRAGTPPTTFREGHRSLDGPSAIDDACPTVG